MARSKPGTLRIGTSGWNYAHWKDIFYPKGLKQADWLSYHAGHFDTVELNASFYRLPKDESIRGWVEATPKRYRFAIKLSRYVTHQKKLKETHDALKTFFDLFKPMRAAGQCGPLLVQLPPNLHVNVDKLDAFLDDLKDAEGSARWKVAVEFRHASWLTDDVYDVLDRHRAAIVLHDMPEGETTKPNDASFVYVRRHGESGKYEGRYTEGELKKDAKRIRAWLGDGRDVWVYFNNDLEGHAVKDAMKLREMCGQ